MRKKEEDQGAKLVRYVLSVLLGGVAALGIGCVFLLVCSIGISRGLLSEGMMYQLTVVGCVLGGFIGGSGAVRQCGSRTLIVGLLVGAVFFLLLLTIGFLFYDAAALEEGGLGLLCGCLCGGAAAGVLGGSRRGNRKHHTKGKHRGH